jgi:hypothetical protein
MDDMESPNQAKYIHDMLEYFIIAENIYVIATSQNQFSPVIEFQYGMEMNGMLEPEVKKLFFKDGNVGHEDEKTEINEIRLLAKNLDYLPLCWHHLTFVKHNVALQNTTRVGQSYRNTLMTSSQRANNSKLLTTLF